MNTRSLIVGQKLAYKKIATGFGMNHTSKGEKSVPWCSPCAKRIRKFEWLSVFIKHKKLTSNFKRRSDWLRIGRDTISNNSNENRISVIWLDAFNHTNCRDRNDHVVPNHKSWGSSQSSSQILGDGGNCDDRDDHMENQALQLVQTLLKEKQFAFNFSCMFNQLSWFVEIDWK